MKRVANIDPEVLAVQPFDIADMLVTKGTGEASGVAFYLGHRGDGEDAAQNTMVKVFARAFQPALGLNKVLFK